MATFARLILVAVLWATLWPSRASAGMPSVTLADVPRAIRRVTQTGMTDLARQRLEVISFFLLGLLIGAGIIRWVWNGLRKDFAFLPRLSYARALGIIVLWGLLFVLVLTMISGTRELMNPEVRVVRSPEGYALSHYAGNVHVLDRDRALRRVGPGDAANTILAGEVADGFKPWGDPTNLRDPGLGMNTVSGGFGGPSGSGANFLFVEGSVRFLRDTTSRAVLRRLSLPRPADR